jgi:hypothetical protein
VLFRSHLPGLLQTSSENELEKSKRAFVKLWIYDGVTRDEVVDYVKKRWRKIQTILRGQDVPRIKRVRKIENKKCNELILKFNKLSTKELRRRTGEHSTRGVYRETMIRRLLKGEGCDVTIEAIKGVIARFRKRNS